MKGCLTLFSAAFLLLFMSCQKDNDFTSITTPEPEYKTVSYQMELDEAVFGDLEKNGGRNAAPCTCRLIAASNVNTTNETSFNRDWRAFVKFQTGSGSVFPARFGTVDEAYTGSTGFPGLDGATGSPDPQLGAQQSISFTPPSNDFELRIGIPSESNDNTFNNDFSGVEVYARVACRNENFGQAVDLTWTQQPFSNLSNIVEGSIAYCSAYLEEVK